MTKTKSPSIGGITPHQIGGVILAGGRATRMNKVDKPLLLLTDKSLIEFVIDRAAPQVEKLVLSVNRNTSAYERFDLPLIPDRDQTCVGPLAGIVSAMSWYREMAPEVSLLSCFAADVPFFPLDIVRDMLQLMQADNSSVCWCKTGEQIQPLFSLWSLDLYEQLQEALAQGIYGPKLVIPRFTNSVLKIDPDQNSGDFFNINTPDDLRFAKRFVSSDAE